VSVGAIPSGWASTPIGELCELVNGRAFKPVEWAENGLPIIRIQNLNDSDAPFNLFNGEIADKHRVEPGDLLFAWSGTPGTSFGAHVWKGPSSALNQHIFNVKFDRMSIDRSFLKYAINQKLDELIAGAHGGVGLRHVTKGKFEKTEILFPPLAEQKEIAAKLDGLLAQVDRIKTRLDAIPAILKRFRQSVLAAAVSGRLTKEWRETNPTNPIETLVTEINAEKKGKLRVRTKCGWHHGLELFNLPENWAWTENHRLAIDTSSAIGAGPFGTIFKARDFRDEGIPIIFLRHVKKEGFNHDNPKFMDRNVWAKLHQEYSVHGGELLVTKLGDPPGESCIFPSDFGVAMVTPDVIKMQPDNRLADTRYLMHFFNSPACKNMVEQLAFGATRLRIDLPMFKAFPIPLPPRNEQDEIVRRVDLFFSLADSVEKRRKAAKSRIDNLTQTILRKAFRGELTADWRDLHSELIYGENSAEALLDRIKQDRGSLGPSTRGRGRSKMTQKRAKPAMTISVIEALERKGEPLDAKSLLTESGYPRDASTEDVEGFLLDVRAMLEEGKIRKERVGDQDFFSLAD